MTVTSDPGYTALFANPVQTQGSSALTYSGPREVLVNQPIILSGSFTPSAIATVKLVAEDKYPLPVTMDSQGIWQVHLAKGLQAAGLRWLRLQGLDGSGQEVSNQVVYITVSTNPLSVGQGWTLKILNDTLFKSAPLDSSYLTNQQMVLVRAGQSFAVARYGSVDDHLQVELADEITPVGKFGYFYQEHVRLQKGAEVLNFDVPSVPTTPLSSQLLITTTTLIKARLADSTTLAADQKVTLRQGQTLAITGYACLQGHYRVTLAKPIPGFGNTGYVYWQHAQLKKGNQIIPFASNALTITAISSTLIKKRPVDATKLAANEKYNFPAQQVYGVASYAIESGHIKVSLTEELPGFGNTGYVFPNFVQMKRGSTVLKVLPPQIELAVPYFSQRDNPRYSWATCNVTSIAMIMYYYGVRSKSGRQLEDELLQWCLQKYGAGSQTDHSVLTRLIQSYGFKTSFSATRKWADVKTELMNRRPVVLAGDFTASGHIICVIGYNAQGYVVHDPWGNALTGYTNTQGGHLLYSYSYMDRVCGPDGNVWAHFIAK